MDCWISVETISETALGSGESESSLVDRDIVVYDLGLPYIPARRLKGALREAAAEVAESLESTLVDLARVDQLFGDSGSSARGWLRLRNLHLDDAAETRTWLAWAMEQHGNSIDRSQVLGTLSSVRSQTAIDHETGAALENTLRRTRVLQRGLRFVGRVNLSAPEGEDDGALRLLALASAAVKRLGLSRNRGLGRVRTRLYGDVSLAEDLTDGALQELAALAGEA